MHRTPYPVSRVVADDAVPVFVCVLLDGPPDIADPISRSGGLDAKLETLLGNTDKLLELVRDLANGNCNGGIANKSLVCRRHIQRDDIAGF
jgi:hypothetical protein